MTIVIFCVFSSSSLAQESSVDLNERLSTIRNEMVLVAESLSSELPDKTTIGSQQRITDELRFLVGQFSAGQKSNEQNAVPQRQPGASQLGTTEGSGMAAADTSEANPENETPNTELNESTFILKAWGQMPGEQTDQRGAGISPRFLPGYESLIREYYRRISR